MSELPPFGSLPICGQLLSGLESLGFTHATPVQSATIPLFLSHKDVFVEACTGSGKTLAFLLPIFQILVDADVASSADLLSLIIAPTRELAGQICQVAVDVLTAAKLDTSISVKLMIGGKSETGEPTHENDLGKLKTAKQGSNLVIGTPGRLEHAMCHNPRPLSAAKLEVLVMDEADRLLDMGFEACVNTILSRLPKQRRTGLFSATQTDSVKQLVRAGLRNPVKVSVKVERNTKDGEVDQRTPASLGNFYMIADPRVKLTQLCHLLRSHSHLKIMVYFLTCACVDYFGTVLPKLFENTFPNAIDGADKNSSTDEQAAEKDPVQIWSLHGKMVHKRRTGVYDQFIKATKGVLLCTDVAARGLDIPSVDLIVQFDPPQDPDAFVHRVGRTARMGKQGRAIVYITEEEDTYVEFLKGRKVPLSKQPTYPTEKVTDVLEPIRALAITDRDVYEKGQRAFVSYVRAYKEHQLGYIFSMARLNLGHLATGFGLIRMPKMPETKDKTFDFDAVRGVDLNAIAYTDKVREKHRLERMEKRNREWEETQEERERWKVKREYELEKLEKQAEKRHKQRRRMHSTRKEWDELAFDARMAKKLKKGKLSQEDFDRILGEEIGDEWDEEGNTKAKDKDSDDIDSGGENGGGEGKEEEMSVDEFGSEESDGDGEEEAGPKRKKAKGNAAKQGGAKGAQGEEGAKKKRVLPFVVKPAKEILKRRMRAKARARKAKRS
eukprot:c5448_g1_i1.p1 GENE.c5448_g1_i1~~c5448_g1_i1.p1  ORF type:complete len:723 (+),score=195.14 c5448_g1_i1:3-2171(+)